MKGNMRLNCKENCFNCEIWKLESASNMMRSERYLNNFIISLDYSQDESARTKAKQLEIISKTNGKCFSRAL